MDKKLLGLNGVFAVFKPAGETSAKTVDRVKNALLKTALPATPSFHHQKRLAKQIKVGHGGTLDPMATGILVIGLNSGCKDLPKYLAGPKSYCAEGRFGEHYDTLDRTGKLLQSDEKWEEKVAEVEAVLDKFVGEAVMQVPPAFSAIHVNGKRAYDLARKESEGTGNVSVTDGASANVTESETDTPVTYTPVTRTHATKDTLTTTPLKEASFTLPPRPVSVSSLSYTPLTLPTFQLSVSCGGGCYIRSLIRDIAAEVGTLAHMTELERSKQGIFEIDMCLKEEEWGNFELVQEAINKAKSLL